MVSSRDGFTSGIQHQSVLMADWVSSDSVRWISISELQLMLWVLAWPPSLLLWPKLEGTLCQKFWPDGQHWVLSAHQVTFSLLCWFNTGCSLEGIDRQTLCPLSYVYPLGFTLGPLGPNHSISCLPYCDQQDKPWANYSITQGFSTCVLQEFLTCNTWLFSQEHWPLFP